MAKENRLKGCTRKAKKTLKNLIKARANKRYSVVGSRKITKKQQKNLLNGYVGACVKDKTFKI